uniref:Uncharacterized protein n=2 Tax=Lygus hesperus TaxID=30085 RepID=A0A0K8T5Y7_LYGHE
MNKLVPLCAVAMWVYQSAADVGLLDYSGQCVSEAGITHEEADSIQQGNPPTSQKGKCYVACVLKSLGVVDQQGKISVDDANRLIEMYSTEANDAKEKTKQAVTACAREANRSRNQCDVSYRMMRCLLRKRGRPAQTRNITIGLPQTITFQLPPLSFTLFSVG